MTELTKAILRHWGYDGSHVILNVLLPFIEAVEALSQDDGTVGFFEFDSNNIADFGKCLYHLNGNATLCRRFYENTAVIETITKAPLLSELFGNKDRRYVVVCRRNQRNSED